MGCCIKRSVQRRLANLSHGLRLPIVHAVRCHVANAAVAVLGVVPGKECLAMASGVFDAAKALREVGAVFHGLELRLRIRVVVRGVGAAVALGHVQVNQQTGHRLGAHG